MAPKEKGSKRSRTEGQSSATSTPNFPEKGMKERYKILSKLPIEPNRFMVVDDLRMVGLEHEVLHLLSRAGWTDFISIREDTHRRLLLEFLASFTLNKINISNTKPGVVKFQLGGRRFSFSILEFSVHLGVITDEEAQSEEMAHSLTSFPSEVSDVGFWREISSSPNYDATQSKSTTLLSPALRYLHRLIAYTICGRQQSPGVVSMGDLIHLYCMVKGERSNIGGSLAYYYASMGNKKRGALCGGTYVTRLAKNLGVFTADEPSIRMEPLGMMVMRNMGLVRKERGQFILVGQGEQQAEPEGDEQLQEEELHDLLMGIEAQMGAGTDAGAGSSQGSRSLEQRIDELTSRVDYLAVSHDGLRDQFQQFSGRFDSYMTQQDARYQTMAQQQAEFHQEMRGYMSQFQTYFQHPPPPPQ